MPATALVIDPFAFLTDNMELDLQGAGRAPIFPYTVEGKERFELEDLYAALNHRKPKCIERDVDMIQVVYPEVLDGDVCYVDEESLLHPPMVGFVYMKGWPEPICGRVLVVGEDDEGYSTSTKWTPEALAPHVALGVGQFEFRTSVENGVFSTAVIEHEQSAVKAWLDGGVKF